ncbi:MAG: L-histidine N(alpha)-methyltransferase [Phycisphaeraceae bacterium]|nr:L-histidine N(alpha)-methyltransferase [Phycisphaeraceae bacterium]
MTFLSSLNAKTVRTLEPGWMHDVLTGMRTTPRWLPTQLLYDARGSELFAQITELPEYYLTRTEMAIFDRHLDEMAAALGPEAWLIELGSGRGIKTRRLLQAMIRPAGFTPVEISQSALRQSVDMLAYEMPDLHVIPVCGDFSRLHTPPPTGHRRVIFFPGSTIGNFDHTAAKALMRRLARWIGPEGGMLLGVDLVKSPRLLIPAYDDAAGITAEFNLNLLDRLNREADADFVRPCWSHQAHWNQPQLRMESYLVSECEQHVHIAGQRFDMGRHECILIEQSQKYTYDSLANLVHPFSIRTVWTDDRAWYAVMYLQLHQS